MMDHDAGTDSMEATVQYLDDEAEAYQIDADRTELAEADEMERNRYACTPENWT